MNRSIGLVDFLIFLFISILAVDDVSGLYYHGNFSGWHVKDHVHIADFPIEGNREGSQKGW